MEIYFSSWLSLLFHHFSFLDENYFRSFRFLFCELPIFHYLKKWWFWFYISSRNYENYLFWYQFLRFVLQVDFGSCSQPFNHALNSKNNLIKIKNLKIDLKLKKDSNYEAFQFQFSSFVRWIWIFLFFEYFTFESCSFLNDRRQRSWRVNASRGFHQCGHI